MRATTSDGTIIQRERCVYRSLTAVVSAMITNSKQGNFVRSGVNQTGLQIHASYQLSVAHARVTSVAGDTTVKPEGVRSSHGAGARATPTDSRQSTPVRCAAVHLEHFNRIA